MADYSYLRRLDVDEATTAEYVFDEVPGAPSIIFKPMAESNPAYMSERIRLAVEKANADAEKQKTETKKQRRERLVSTAVIEEDRENDRVLMARTCAVGWGVAPRDINGREPKFSEDECYQFLSALPNHMLDPCRGWVANIRNFISATAFSEIEAEILGKSRQTDSDGS